MVAHSKISKFLMLPHIKSWLSMEVNETWRGNTRVADAIQKWPNSDEANETGYALAHGKSLFEVLTTNPERAMRMAQAIRTKEHIPGFATRDVSNAYDWASLGDAFIVNIGGQGVQVAIELAQNFGNLNLIIQDSAMMIAGAESSVPDTLKGRIEFQEHAFFEPQTVQADVYFFYQIFRNWGDKYAVKALKAQTPVLRPGAKILIYEECMSEQGAVPMWIERIQRCVDMNLKNFFNGRERYLDEWKALLAAADERLVLHRVHKRHDSWASVLEVHWVA
ncbi:hypothetical protein CDD82_7341 [Ophiocordyceps australis]|uniref:O-methyltransferase C-terminal domain-containing protein n=1 Tax=Ophiocordyceps australis TaxID=1399860 RepID=A0A2C5YQU8_9HYPO|nr:hypothetical protein CDD82_7341 [Ophiocordyceps australis]